MPETALTPETKVGVLAGAQFQPAVSALPGGAFVIAWYDSQRGAIYGQRYDAAGQTNGSEFAMSDGGFVSLPSITALAGGGFVAVWQSGIFDQANIRGQRFDASGAPVGAAFIVNEFLPNEQTNPHVTALDNGGFVVTWDAIATGYFQDVSARTYDSLGQASSAEFIVNTNTTFSQGISSVTALADGFVVTWQSADPIDDTQYNLFGQRFGLTGAKIGTEFKINTVTPANLASNDVARLSDGSFVVTWIDQAANNGGGRVVARHFTAAGAPIGGEILVDGKSSDKYVYASVTALADGGYVVSWTDDNGTDQPDNNVSARAFAANDMPAGAAFDVGTGNVFTSVLRPDGSATLTNGNVVFTWDGPSVGTGTGQDIYFRLYSFSAPGNPGEGGPGPDNLPGTGGDDTLNGNGGDDTLSGQGGNDTLDGGDGNDALSSGTGTDILRGGTGNDSLYFGANLTNADTADGGDGIDSLIVQGNYAALALPATPGIEVLLVASGSDNRFGDTAGNSYDYVITATDANVPAGGILTVMATGLLAGEDLVFDGSAESDGGYRIFAGRGIDQLTGGGGSDGFFFGADGNLTAADVVVGGGGIDTLALRGNYNVTFQNGSFSGIEVLALLSGLTNEYGGPIAPGGYDYVLALANGNIASGARLDVNAVRLAASESVLLDARAELDGSVRILAGAGEDTLFGSANGDVLYGGLGADAIDGGGGADLYLYRSALESTAAARDVLTFTAGDKIDLGVIDAISGTAGVNDAFAFIGDAAFSAAGQLRAFQSGDQWIVEGDVNGDGVADLVIAVSGVAAIVAGDFVL